MSNLRSEASDDGVCLSTKAGRENGVLVGSPTCIPILPALLCVMCDLQAGSNDPYPGKRSQWLGAVKGRVTPLRATVLLRIIPTSEMCPSSRL